MNYQINYDEKMKNKIELLAPGGDIDSIKAAIIAGADAIYCGLDKFNARSRAVNINFDELNRIITLAHKNNCKIFLTINIIILENEINSLIKLLNKLVNTAIDAIIVQDLGLFYILSQYFKTMEVHASTQTTTHNEGQIKFFHKLAVNRVNLSRELNIDEITNLTSISHKNDISTEVFVHGSYCISFSGICYMSSVKTGKSGNRGRCSQPCRDRYLTTPAAKNYPLNLKDNSAYFDLKELADAKVDSLKIEGRIKKYDFVYTVVNCWKKQIQSFYDKHELNNDNSDLYKVFNRDFSNCFLKGDINKNAFIDNPRDYSIKRLSVHNNLSAANKITEKQKNLYEEKENIKAIVKNKIEQLSIAKVPLKISVSGKNGTPLKVEINTPETSFTVYSAINLVEITTNSSDFTTKSNLSKDKKNTARELNSKVLLTRLKALNNEEHYIEHLELAELQHNLFIPFGELTSIKKRILSTLNNFRKTIAPITVPFLKKDNLKITNPALSILINSQDDLSLYHKTTANIYFQLPNCFEGRYNKLLNLFLDNNKLIPWFPAISIGTDYTAAVKFLKESKVKLIVTNNTGIAYEAYKLGISWIAGPYLNIVNSYSLLNLKENFNCYGAFISNEINKKQIQNIVRPRNFKLHYSLYHPIVLMTSRQCFFHQTSGCKKERIDKNCLPDCCKTTTITSLDNTTFFIEKSKGNYNRIYNNRNFLNTEIVSDLPNLFTDFFIDLRDVETETRIKTDKLSIIKLFERLLSGDTNSIQDIKQQIQNSTNTQYLKGI